MLNGLFTGTPRDVRREGDNFYPPRGRGNTLMGWDGVHPNSAGYSLVANEAIRVLNAELKAHDYGGLEAGTSLPWIPGETITTILKEKYLGLGRSRIYDWQMLLSKVK
jgi:hypothetical protein